MMVVVAGGQVQTTHLVYYRLSALQKKKKIVHDIVHSLCKYSVCRHQRIA
jgi:hypothetical protein